MSTMFYKSTASGTEISVTYDGWETRLRNHNARTRESSEKVLTFPAMFPEVGLYATDESVLFEALSKNGFSLFETDPVDTESEAW